MTKIFPRIALATATCAIAFSATASTPRDVDDLVGARASGGESALKERGYYHMGTSKGSDRAWAYWWNPSNKTCLSVVTMEGRYDSIESTPSFDCEQSESGGNSDSSNSEHDKKVAAAVAAAAVLGAVALAHKSHHHDDNSHYEDSNREAEYDRGFRDGQYNHSYDDYNRSSDYVRGYEEGVRSRDDNSSYRYHSNRHNTSGYTASSDYSDLVGARASSADSSLRDRGFRDVDHLKSGNTPYTIWYNRSTRQCLQMATVDGRADSIVDIHTHPACH